MPEQLLDRPDVVAVLEETLSVSIVLRAWEALLSVGGRSAFGREAICRDLLSRET
jgi:hypothetical protein